MAYISKTLLFVAITALLSMMLSYRWTINQIRHPNADLNMEQLLNKFGYYYEIHNVTTEDGYELSVYRIPHARLSKSRLNNKRRIPILIMHGLLHSSIDFISLGPEKSLGLKLADEGFDVWLPNARGSTYSRRHQKLDPDRDSEYWDFSMHEIGYYDLPALIDYILKQTGEEKLHYIGYSQGTQAFGVLASEKPEYNDKIRLVTALAPALFLKDPESPFVQFVINIKKFLGVKLLTSAINYREIFSHDSLISKYLKLICDENSFFVDLCVYHFTLLQGDNREYVNKTNLAVMTSNVPSGMSLKQLQHIIQLMETGEFKQFDYGSAERNFEKYSQEEPPHYNVANIKAPMMIYYSRGDWVVNYKNMETLQANLPNIVKSYEIPWENFNHNDFIYSDEAVRLLYNGITKEIVKH